MTTPSSELLQAKRDPEYCPEAIGPIGAQVPQRDFDRKRRATLLAGSPLSPRPDLQKDAPLTRALRSQELWLTLTYLALLMLMAKGFAS